MNHSNLRVVTLFFLIICVGLYFYTDEQKKYYDATAIPVATLMLKEISNWEKKTLLKHLSPAAKATLNDQQIETLLNHYRQFGQLQTIDELAFSRLASALSLFGEPRINYTTGATYSKTRAHINITLSQQDNSYKIYNFTINKGS